MVALAKSMVVGQNVYPAGTDHTTMPVDVVDLIRNPTAWVGGVAPRLSPGFEGKRPISRDDLRTVGSALAALGIATPGGSALINITARGYEASPSATAAQNTIAIQAAIDAAQTAGTGIFVPPGTFTCNPLTINQPIEIAGAGWRSTLKLANGSNAYLITFADLADPGIRGAYIHDLRFDCNGLNQTATSGGINARSAIQCFFERLCFTTAYSAGIKLDGLSGGTAFGHHNRIISCLFENSASVAGDGMGVLITNADENWLIACDFEYLGGAGAEPRMVKDWSGLNYVMMCNFVGGGHNCEGVRLQDCNRTRVVGCTFDGVSGPNVAMSGTKHLVEGCTFTFIGDQGTAPAPGVLIDFAATNNIVKGNVFESSQTANRTRAFVRETGSGGGGNNTIEGNDFTVVGALSVGKLEIGGTGTIIRNNRGYTTEAKGVATVASGATTAVVTHGLDRTPTVADVMLTPTNGLGNAAKYWVSTPTATQFTINVNADPGATTAAFAWQATVL